MFKAFKNAIVLWDATEGYRILNGILDVQDFHIKMIL